MLASKPEIGCLASDRRDGLMTSSSVPETVDSRDVSLVETLLLVLGPATNRFPDLVRVVSELSNETPRTIGARRSDEPNGGAEAA